MTYQVEMYGPRLRWFAVRTKTGKEKAASCSFSAYGIPHFLPLQSVVRQWSDRQKVLNTPLFPSYLFVQVDPLSKSKLQVLMTPGVVEFVGNLGGPQAIPDTEIDSVRRLVQCGAASSPQKLLQKGDRVRIVGGPLTGMEGTLLRIGSKLQLVVSIDLIQRSVAVTVSETDVEVLIETNTLEHATESTPGSKILESSAIDSPLPNQGPAQRFAGGAPQG